MPPWLADRNSVIAVCETCLVLSINGSEHRVTWEAVQSVVAGSALVADGEIFVLALDIEEGDATRLFAVAETEKIWPVLTRMLTIGLPTIASFEWWGAALVDKPGAMTLYERAAQGVVS